MPLHLDSLQFKYRISEPCPVLRQTKFEYRYNDGVIYKQDEHLPVQRVPGLRLDRNSVLQTRGVIKVPFKAISNLSGCAL